MLLPPLSTITLVEGTKLPAKPTLALAAIVSPAPALRVVPAATVRDEKEALSERVRLVPAAAVATAPRALPALVSA